MLSFHLPTNTNKKVAMYRQNMNTCCIVCSVGVFVTFRITLNQISVREKNNEAPPTHTQTHIKLITHPHTTNQFIQKRKRYNLAWCFLLFSNWRPTTAKKRKRKARVKTASWSNSWARGSIFLMFDFLLYLIWAKIRFSFLKKIHTYKLTFVFFTHKRYERNGKKTTIH